MRESRRESKQDLSNRILAGEDIEERDITILEDEVEASKLTITSLRAQLEEQVRGSPSTRLHSEEFIYVVIAEKSV